ncbi:MAG: hypothetical protein KAK00_03465 [Nanoarchaeota archaeon]|nr:hypothetical protein [Nanoarchaeota archaeon]
MVWWTEKGSFENIKKIDNATGSALENLKKLEKLFDKKIELIKKVREEKDKENPSEFVAEKKVKELKGEIEEFLNLLKYEEILDYRVSKYESQVLRELSKLLRKEEKNPINKRALKLNEINALKELRRILKNLLELWVKEKNFLMRCVKRPVNLLKFFYEFEEYCSSEARLLMREKELEKTIEIMKKATVTEQELTKCLVGYGSLMVANEVMGELKGTLKLAHGEETEKVVSDWRAEFKARVTPVTVMNFRRIFRKVASRGRWETMEDVENNRVGVLDIEPKMGYKFNGIAIKLTEKEFNIIMQRENDYGYFKLSEVYDFISGEKINSECFAVKSERYKSEATKQYKDTKAYMESARKKYSFGQNPDLLIRSNILPVPHYLNTIEKGVKELDSLLGTKNMHIEFYKTTYLFYADRDLGMDFGCINLIKFYQILEYKRKVIGKLFKKAVSKKDFNTMFKLYKEITGENISKAEKEQLIEKWNRFHT